MLGKLQNMLGSKIKQEYARKRNEYGFQLKSYNHTPKPQIQGIEPMRGRLRARTLPCDCREKGGIKSFLMCFWERNVDKRERKLPTKFPKNALKKFFF